MTYRVIRHPEVEHDLFDLTDLVADYAGIEIATRKLDEIESTLKNLSHTPHIGSLRHEIYANLRAIPVAGKGVISFIVDDDEKTVLILAITYAGADWIGRMPDRA